MTLKTRRYLLFPLALFCIPLLVVLLVARPASAQNNPISFETVGVDVWPEYDQPAVLVMYNITLSSQVKLPATLTMRIPASAGQPHALATKDINGMYNLQYQTAPAGEWTQISFTTSMPELRLEFYDPSFSKQGTQRTYIYQWPADYAANRLVVQIQQPANATGMTISPDAGSGTPAEDGLTYFNLDAGSVPAGSPLDLNISYSKADDTLTNAASFQQVQPSQPLNDATSGRITINEVLPWLVGGLGVLLIGAGIWWYMRLGQTAPAAAGRARHAVRRTANPMAPGSKETTRQEGGKHEAIYCHQCGKRAGPGDSFCRVCGTKLK